MHKKIIHICLALKMLLCINIALAQSTEDSTLAVPKGKTRLTYFRNISLNPDLLLPKDTSFTGVQRQYNPGYMQNLGNLATPVFPLVWSPRMYNGFNFGFNQWDALLLNSGNIQLFNTQNPFTELSYTQGPEKLQSINVLHTQNIFPYWNAAVQLKREGSEGYYTQQNSRGGNFGFSTWYRSPNRRYMAAASIAYNDYNFQENGGIIYDSAFENPNVGSRARRGAQVQLARAKQIYKDKEYNLQQFLYFGPKSVERAATDTDSVSVTVLKPRFYVTHQINYSTQDYYFEDLSPSDSFYRFFYYNDDVTKDTYKFKNLANKAGVGYFYTDTARRRNYGLQGFAKFAYINLSQNALIRNYTNTSIGFEGVMAGALKIEANGELFMQGYNAGDFYLDGGVTVPFLKKINLPFITAFARLQQNEPDFIQQRFTGNHFWWDNNFDKSRSIFIGGNIWGNSPRDFKIGAAYAIVNNFVFYNDSAHPQQAATDLHYVSFNVQKEFVLARHFHFLHDITFQSQLQGDYIRIPNWVIRTSYFYEGKWTPTLTAQVGFDFWYNTEYYAYGYMPSISKFYAQNDVRIGNYPMFDAFIAGKVKRFMMFFKVEHVTQDLFGQRYYSTVHYPVNPRTFRFGLKWSFYN